MEELNINSMNLLQIDLMDESTYYGKKFRKLKAFILHTNQKILLDKV